MISQNSVGRYRDNEEVFLKAYLLKLFPLFIFWL